MSKDDRAQAKTTTGEIDVSVLFLFSYFGTGWRSSDHGMWWYEIRSDGGDGMFGASLRGKIWCACWCVGEPFFIKYSSRLDGFEWGLGVVDRS